MRNTPVLEIAPEAVQRWHTLLARRARMAAGRCACNCRCSSMTGRAERTPAAFEMTDVPAPRQPM